MKNNTIFILILLLFSSCNSSVKTNEKEVVMIEMKTEFMVLDEQFTIDSTRYQTDIIKYDHNNNILEEMNYVRGQFLDGMIYKYDVNGKITDEYFSLSDKNYTHYKHYKYEYLPNQVNKYEFSRKESPKSPKVESVFYDSIRNIIKTINYSYDGGIISERYNYYKTNNVGQIVEDSLSVDGKYINKHTYTYDIFLCNTERLYVDSTGICDGEKFVYKDYDKKGNWQKRLSYKNNKPHKIMYRSFEYK